MESSDKDSAKSLESAVVENIYYPTKHGTKLEQAIQCGSQFQLEEILKTYKSDLNKVKDYVIQKYNWNVKDKIWTRKIVLIAANDKQCQEAKQLENCSAKNLNLEHAVVILLLIPVKNENVAVIHPSDDICKEIYSFIRSLIPYGFLSLNYTSSDMKIESLVELAASRGNKAAITRLIEYGAELDFAKHNPLLAACTSLQNEMIEWLLTEHFDNFDCTARNSNQFNAFMILMQKNAPEMMDFVLEKMILYRQKNNKETASEAFNKIFRCEHNVYTRSSILSIIGSKFIRDKIEKYIVQYQLNLEYQWKGITMLTELLYKKLALDYCWAAIRNEPTLLGLIVQQDITIVHECIRLGFLEILNEMYEKNPDVKRYFENNQAFQSLQQTLWHGERVSAEFILRNHYQFFLDNFYRLKRDVIFCHFHSKSFFENNRDQLINYFPMLKSEIDAKVSEKPQFYPGQDLMMAFHNFNLPFDDSIIEHEGSDFKSLANLRGTNGATLLHYAVETSNIPLFTNLHGAGCDLNAVDDEGNHAIHYIRTIDMFNFLIGIHPDGRSLVHRTNSAGFSVLHRVCQLRSNYEEVTSMLEAVLECGANVNQVTNRGESVLFMISNSKVLDVLVKHNIKLDIVNSCGETALQRLLKSRNKSLSNDLLRLTHQLSSFKEHAHNYIGPIIFNNRVHFTQVFRPFLQANPNTMRILFDSIVNHSLEHASRMLSIACSNGPIFVVEKFLDFNYDLDYNYPSNGGQTPIIGLLNCNIGQNDMLVKKLLEKEVDLEIRDDSGRNALLTYANRFTSAEEYDNSIPILQRLLDCGANINAQDKDGNTALHVAFAHNELELVDVLLRNGANYSMKNKEGKIPTQLGISIYRDMFCFLN